MSSCKYLTSNKGVYTNSNSNAANTDLNIYINAYSQHIENLTSIIILCLCRNEIHRSSSPVTPISLEQIKQEQSRLVALDTDWNIYDYGNVYQNK